MTSAAIVGSGFGGLARPIRLQSAGRAALVLEARDRIFAYLGALCSPSLPRDLMVSRIVTPRDFRDTLNPHVGSAVSLEPILTESAYVRADQGDDKISDLNGVGDGSHPGAGPRGRIGSAKPTASPMIADGVGG